MLYCQDGDPNLNMCCGPSTWSTSLYTRLEYPSLAKLDIYVPRYGLWMIFKATDLGWCVIKQPPLVLNLGIKVSLGIKAWHHRELLSSFGDHILPPNRAPPQSHEIVQHNKPSIRSLGYILMGFLAFGHNKHLNQVSLSPWSSCPLTHIINN